MEGQEEGEKGGRKEGKKEKEKRSKEAKEAERTHLPLLASEPSTSVGTA